MNRSFSMSRTVKSGLVSLLLLCCLNVNGIAQTTSPAQKIMAAMIEALGGKAFLDVKEIQSSGRFFSFRRDEVAGSDIFSDYIKFPNMGRTEFGRERSRSIQINNGDEGWVLTGRNGEEVKPQSASQAEEYLAQLKTSFDYVTRFVINTPKSTMLATGTEIVEFRRTDIVEVRDTEKNLIRFFVDRETRLPAKIQVRRAEDSVLYEEYYGNWHRFQGVMTPLFIARFKDGVKVMEIRPEKVAYNPGLADTLFAPPAKK
jgi:hypothetical protein